MNNPKFFRFPFAATGDKTPLPDEGQENGTISYAEGYGFDYERNPATDPQAKRIERDKMNQLYYDITHNIRQYQLQGVPQWIDQSSNGNMPVTYQKNAMVRFKINDQQEDIYISLKDFNTDTPTDVKS
ncbi:hypothetical protein [Bartonella tamiae]|uniref:Uncharacterized protein n=1 Tax=Bartonella tamiae Th239 TaxID=1094558 RepID=J1JX00_9HYPH|nr:hypothetical protein [Bartonella tamiae]EJF89125.1 hypothetical protein ME5_01676 [Bartonella tamiae Th239]EJF95472.1 hypothetical protein MEG_00205 [Bartonella tamiae Th307]